MVVTRKLCCLCVRGNKLATNDGWPRVLQACKGEGNKMLDQDKKGSSKAKEDMSVIFGLHLW